MSFLWGILEYSICLSPEYIWSTSNVYIPQISITPFDHLLLTSGVLMQTMDNNFEAFQMYSGIVHLEYSRCNRYLEIWSSNSNPYLEALQMSPRILHLEYSRCNVYHNIWSTPDFVRDCYLESKSKPWTITFNFNHENHDIHTNFEDVIWSTHIAQFCTPG